MEYLEFKDGTKMPIVGLGTLFATDEAELGSALDSALEAGYRHFDTAYVYENEAMLGRTFQRWFESGKVKREELFIVTKLPEIGMSPSRVEHFLTLSLAALQLDYVDLYLIHAPFGLQYLSDSDMWPKKNGKVLIDETSSIELVWKEMEAQVRAGRAKSIGVSNFSESQIERILDIGTIPVANLQIELHVYFQQRVLRETCKKHGITVVAYGPLGSPGRAVIDGIDTPPLLRDPLINEIANAHGKSPSQILLKFVIQLGVAVIPKSTNPERLRANISLFDFKLSEEEMKAIEALDQEDGRSFVYLDNPGMEEHPEVTF